MLDALRWLSACGVIGLALALFAAPAATADDGDPLDIRVTQRKLNPEAPRQERIDSLAWRGGLELTSPSRNFGGLSGLYVAPDGDDIVLVTDQGNWLAGRLTYDERGWLSGFEDARLGRLKDERGEPVSQRPNRRDAEALARRADGSWVVTFEQTHRVRVYPPGPLPDGTAEALPVPGDLPPGSNQALEAITELPDGRLIALREGAVSLSGPNTVYRGYIYEGTAWQPFDYVRPKPTQPTDMAVGPDGLVYVSERHWSPVGGLTIRIARFDPAALAPGATIQATTLATLRPPLTIDNFEGIFLRESEKGAPLVYVVSDDNFSAIQRTLLVMFEVVSE